MPPLRAPSPITATTLFLRPCRSRETANPRAAEIDVDACAAPKGSYSLLRTLGEARQAAALAQGADAVAPAGQDLVGVALVPDIPYQDIFRRVEQVVQGDGELDHAEPGPEMAAGVGHRIDGLGAQLLGNRLELGSRTGRGDPRAIRLDPDSGSPRTSPPPPSASPDATRIASFPRRFAATLRENGRGGQPLENAQACRPTPRRAAAAAWVRTRPPTSSCPAPGSSPGGSGHDGCVGKPRRRYRVPARSGANELQNQNKVRCTFLTFPRQWDRREQSGYSCALGDHKSFSINTFILSGQFIALP